MMPGVIHLPVASITTASAGAVTSWPTATTLPFCSRSDPRSIAGPAAVRIVALRMTVGRDAAGLWVEAHGLGAGCCSAATAVAAINAAHRKARMLTPLLRGSPGCANYMRGVGHNSLMNRIAPALIVLLFVTACSGDTQISPPPDVAEAPT